MHLLKNTNLFILFYYIWSSFCTNALQSDETKKKRIFSIQMYFYWEWKCDIEFHTKKYYKYKIALLRNCYDAMLWDS